MIITKSLRFGYGESSLLYSLHCLYIHNPQKQICFKFSRSQRTKKVSLQLISLLTNLGSFIQWSSVKNSHSKSFIVLVGFINIYVMGISLKKRSKSRYCTSRRPSRQVLRNHFFKTNLIWSGGYTKVHQIRVHFNHLAAKAKPSIS